jgi:hypothetical protein
VHWSSRMQMGGQVHVITQVEQQTENTRRAWSYNGAVDAGFEPQSYSWEDVPTGTWVARLDFKVWSNKTAARCLGCYFTSLVDGCRFPSGST